MKQLNSYFFGEESISFQDGFYFYGTILMSTIVLFLL